MKAHLLVLGLSVAAAAALPTNDKVHPNDPLGVDCTKKEPFSCIKYKFFSFVDKMLSEKDDITLSEGITVVKTSSADEGAPRLGPSLLLNPSSVVLMMGQHIPLF